MTGDWGVGEEGSGEEGQLYQSFLGEDGPLIGEGWGTPKKGRDPQRE